MTVTNIGHEPKDVKTGELSKRIHDLIDEYRGELCLGQVIGALEVVKMQVYEGQQKE